MQNLTKAGVRGVVLAAMVAMGGAVDAITFTYSGPTVCSTSLYIGASGEISCASGASSTPTFSFSPPNGLNCPAGLKINAPVSGVSIVECAVSIFPDCGLAGQASTVPGKLTLKATCVGPAATFYAWTGAACASTTGDSCDVPAVPLSDTLYSVTGVNSMGTGSTGIATIHGQPVGTAVEFYHPVLNHYFMTAYSDEATALVTGAQANPQAWQPTGKTWKVWISNYGKVASELSAACRFFGTDAFKPNGKRIGANSHFYTADTAECESVKIGYLTLANDGKQYPAWTFEGNAYYALVTGGACPAGTTPIYRLYNNGQGGEPNHRYYTDPAVQTEMLDKGWVAEPANGNPVMCGPQ